MSTFSKKNQKASFSKSSLKPKKKRINWSQSLKSLEKPSPKDQKKRKSLQYIFLLKKFGNKIEYTNVKLLKGFLTKYAKIRPRRKTRLKVQEHRKIANSIKKARAFGLLPFTADVRI